MSRDAEALAAVSKALETAPDFAPALEVRAQYAEQAGKFEEALADFDRAAASDPENPDYAYRAARLSMQLEGLEAATHRLRKVVSLSPGHVAATNDLAWHLAEEGKELDLALSLANRAIQLERGM